MRTKLSGLIAALFVLLLASSSAQAQSIGPAKWIRQAWAEGLFIPLDILVGPGEEVFVTGHLEYGTDVYFEDSPVDSSATGGPGIVALQTGPSIRTGFFAVYDGEDGAMRFVRHGRMVLGEDYGLPGREAGFYGDGTWLAVIDGRLYHGEGTYVDGYGTPRGFGAVRITVRDLEGSGLQSIGPHFRDPIIPEPRNKGVGLDARENIYTAGVNRDTLRFSPDIVLPTSRSYPHRTRDVFVADFSPAATARWAHRKEGGGNGPEGMVPNSVGIRRSWIVIGLGFPEPLTRAIHYRPWNCQMIFRSSIRGYTRRANPVGCCDTISCGTSASLCSA